MRVLSINKNNVTIASITSNKKEISSAQSALQLIIYINSNAKTNRLIIDKNLLDDVFYNVENGIAKAVCAEFKDYGFKVSFYGDFSEVFQNNKPFKIFAQENKDFTFVNDKETAITKVSI